MPSKVLVRIIGLGRMEFSKAYAIQQETANRVHSEALNKSDAVSTNTLITVEHDPVYTVGIRSKGYTADDEKRLRDLGADFVRTNRGGLITFHGHGQLVAYPILYLGSFHKKKSMRWYVSSLENTIIDFCSRFGLTATTTEHTGVWIDEKKVAAIGIHGSRFVTTHGIAINCNTDLRWYDHIVPCGIEGKGVTSLSEELGRDVTIDEARPVFVDAFRKQFNCDTVEITT